MLIVSQDKKCMTEDLNIYIKSHNPNIGEVIYAIENDEFILGEYKTEERAKEVLKDIISRYEAIELFKMNSSEKEGYTLSDYTPIYEMPKEWRCYL